MLLSALLAARQPTLQLTPRYENHAQAELYNMTCASQQSHLLMKLPGWPCCIATASTMVIHVDSTLLCA